MPRYSTERKQAVLKKLLPPESLPVPEVSISEGISQGTLYNWLYQVRDGGGVVAGSRASNAEQWSAEAKLAVVLETQPMNEAEASEYCRKKGLYREQIERWRLACLSGVSN
ncbi:MAG: transposase, partial [Granulosicoccus sp.]